MPMTNVGGLLSDAAAEAANPAQTGLLQTIGTNQQMPPESFYDSVIYPLIGKAEGGYTRKPDDPGNWTGFQRGKGQLVGTNMGVTSRALAEYRGVNPNSITSSDMKNLSQDEAYQVLKNEYYIAPGIQDLPRDIQPIVASTYVVRPSAGRAAMNAQNPKEAIDLALRDFSKIPKKGKYYESRITGWTNRIREAAGMSSFKNKDQVYAYYPFLKPKR